MKEEYKPISLMETKENEEFASRTKYRGIINSNTNSSISIGETGEIDLSSSAYANYKISSNGLATETSIQSNTVTNHKNISTDAISINRHKLNPALWDLTDFKQLESGSNEKIVGNLNMTGTVLVKAWEPSLKKYVLIRRPIRMPIFSTTLNIPDTPENVKSDDLTGIEKDLMEYLLNKKNKKE